MSSVLKYYEYAKEIYASIGVDTQKAIDTLRSVPISLHCWQGDDVTGFENLSQSLTGGIMATGNYPGKPNTPSQLRDDLSLALSLIPGEKKVNVHALYIEPTKGNPDRDEISPEHFGSWVDFAKDKNIGLDFNPSFFSHVKSESGFTLSSHDKAIRDFWIEHGKRSRKVGEHFGKSTGKTCITNIWIPDGYKDFPIDKSAPREYLLDSLNKMREEKIDPHFNKDAVESKVFGIGSEAYVTGSHEFYMGYAIKTGDCLLCLDAGHFHPEEKISSKISSMLLFIDELLLHVSRPLRWDSDHVVLYDDELQAIMSEVVRLDALNKIYIALDYFDASINRIAAWVIGARNTSKALLRALLEPVNDLKRLEVEGDWTSRLALTEEYKTYPFNAVWDYYCEISGMPVRDNWLKDIKKYENDVLSNR